MRTRIPGIMRAVGATAWAIVPEKLDAMLDMLELRAAGVAKSDEDIRAIMSARREASIAPRGGKIAVLPLFGVVSQRANMMTEYSGGTSTEAFAASFDAAMANTDVGAIVIDCDSPGGSVTGVSELAARIYAARGQGKRIIAVANAMMASAAYWVCAAADEIVATPSALVGSIGVFGCHIDESGADEQAGIKRTLISAGKYKTEGNSFEPLSDEARAAEQATVDEYYGMFVADVAKGRGVKAKDIEAGYGQGRCLPARHALAAGLIDRVATLEQVLADLGAPGAGMSGKARRAASTQLRVAVSHTNGGVFGIGPDTQQLFAEAVALGLLSAAKRKADTEQDDDLDEEEDEEKDEEDFVAGKNKDVDEGDVDAILDEEDDDKEEEMDCARPKKKGRRATAVSDTTGRAVAALSIPPASNRPTLAPEHIMSTATHPAPSGAGTPDAVAQERSRVSQITALCAQHNASDRVQAFIDGGTSVEAAGHAILQAKQAAPSPAIRMGADREAEQPFANFGEQLQAIVRSTKSPHAVDKRLLHIQAAASGMGESTPSDGGFAIQTDFSTEIIRRAYVVGQILSRVRTLPISESANGLKINAVDETSRVTGSRYGGIQSYWANEADTVLAKKPKLRQMQLELRKLFAIWYLTDELMQDSTALGALATDAFAEEITFMVEDAILNGPGNGQPLGIFASNAVVSVAKEAGQAAATFNANNAAKMFARLWARSLPSAVWLMNQDVLPQLITMTLGGATGYPVYLPPGQLSQAPFGSLLGRPIVPIEYAATLGTPGDIALVDLSQYLLIDKGGPQQAQSIHVRFLNDETTFRITYRVDGQPIWNVPLTPKNGTNTLSPFITLQTR